MSATVGPDGQPSRFDRLPGFQPNLFLIGMVVVLIAAGIFAVQRIQYNTAHPDGVAMGITNGKIDSPTQIEFDYAQSISCMNTFFTIRFLDQNGNQVGDDLVSLSGAYVPANKTMHFTETLRYGQIPSSAVRFIGVATCRA